MAWDDSNECPLCMEPLDVDDISFFPCTCGYQICRFCWHRIRTDENGLCPACRKQYQEGPAEFKPLTEDDLHRIKKERKQKDHQRKQKAAENKRHLANLRVVQKNLVFVIGLSQRLADPEVLKRNDYFGKFGKIMKVVINQGSSSQRTSTSTATSSQSASAYITYYRPEDCLNAIQAVNNKVVDGRTLKASLGTTKYCSHFLKGTHCPKPDCMYLHELGEDAASFTKEEMQANKHHDYELKLAEMYLHSKPSDCGGSSSNSSSAAAAAAALVSTTPPPTATRRYALSSTPPQQSSHIPGVGGPNRKKGDNPTIVAHPVEPGRLSESAPQSGGDARPLALVAQTTTHVKQPPDTQSGSIVSRDLSSGNGSADKLLPAPGNSNTNCGSSPPPTLQTKGFSGALNSSVDSTRITECLGTTGSNNVIAVDGDMAQVVSDTLSSAILLKDGSAGVGVASLDHRRLQIPPLLSSEETTNSLVIGFTADVKPTTGGTASAGTQGYCVNWSDLDSVYDTDHLQGEDDLGFDPWNESSKALADLMAKEQGLAVDETPSHVTPGSNGTYWQPAAVPASGRMFPSGSRLATLIDSLQPQQSSVGPPNGTLSHQSMMASAILSPALGSSPVTLQSSDYSASAVNHGRPPSAFSVLHRSAPSGTTMQSLGTHSFMATRDIGVLPAMPGPTVPSGEISACHSSDSFNLKDWQEGLKALLPNVPINFAAPPPSRRAEHLQTLQPPQARHLVNHNLHKSWSGTERKLDEWNDPAIIMSAPADHGPVPHWMKSIQQLADSPADYPMPHPTGAAKLGSRLPFFHSFAGSGAGGWPSMAVHSPPPGFHLTSPTVFRSTSTATSSQAAHIQRQES